MSRRRLLTLGTISIACAAVFVLGLPAPGEQAGPVLDEARQAGLPAKHFLDHVADEDYFHDMDGAIALTPAEIKGRNTWLVWTGGNDRLWDVLSTASFGNLDFLKTVSSHPGLKFSRDNRWSYLGLVNEPCFEKATGPDPGRFGLWLDKRRADCPADPFENEAKYPGVPAGARGKARPTATRAGSWACGSSPTPPSTRRRRGSGTRRAITKTRPTICRRTS